MACRASPGPGGHESKETALRIPQYPSSSRVALLGTQRKYSVRSLFGVLAARHDEASDESSAPEGKKKAEELFPIHRVEE
jgi:hypothetical protein